MKKLVYRRIGEDIVVPNKDVINNSCLYISFMDKYGAKVEGNVMQKKRYNYYFNNGSMRKTPKVLDKFGINFDLHFTDKNGVVHPYHFEDRFKNVDIDRYSYTYADLLNIINKYSCDKYSGLRINNTPVGQKRKYTKRNLTNKDKLKNTLKSIEAINTHVNTDNTEDVVEVMAVEA